MTKKIHLLFLVSLLCFTSYSCQKDEIEPEVITTEQANKYLETPTEWLFMFYLGGDNNLEPFLLQDINEIVSSSFNPAIVKVIILLDRPKNPSTHEILGNTSNTRFYTLMTANGQFQLHQIELPGLNLSPLVQSELNMGDKNTFSEFLKYGKSLPAQKYALFLGSHGSSWWNEFYQQSQSGRIVGNGKQSANIKNAIIYDDTLPDNQTSNLKPALDIETVGEVLTTFPVDIVGFDACSMSAIEVAYALRNGTRYMVGSVDLEPAEGWNYQKILNGFTQGGSALSLGKLIVDEYADFYKDWDDPVTSITMALLDLSAFSNSSFQNLFLKNGQYSLLTRLPKDSSIYFLKDMPKLGDLTTTYDIQFDTSYLLTDKIGLDADTKQELLNFESELIIYKYISNKKYPNLSGLGISVIPNIATYQNNYQYLSFWYETIWGDYITSLYSSQ